MPRDVPAGAGDAGEEVMTRHLRVAAAQLGPTHKADGRTGFVARLMAGPNG